MSQIQGFSNRSGEQLAPSHEQTARLRDRRSLAVFAISAFAIGSNAVIGFQHWSLISAGQARGLGFVAGIVGGLVVLKIAGRLLPSIFRVTQSEER